MMARACTFQALDRRARACQTKSTLREETIHVHVHLERTDKQLFFIINSKGARALLRVKEISDI
jgi:hypothetical protein